MSPYKSQKPGILFQIMTRTQKFNYTNFSIRGSQIVGGFNCLFDSWPFYRAKSWKTENTVLGYEKGKKFNPTRFSEPWPQYCGWFHLLFLVMAILSSQKLKKAKYRFWLQKGVKSSIRYNFLIRNPEIVDSFICYFWFMAILSNQKF